MQINLKISLLLLVVIGIGITFSVTPAFAQGSIVVIGKGSGDPACVAKNTCYMPNKISINVGDTVTWSNTDSADHTVTSGSASNGIDGKFDSGLFAPGKGYYYNFKQEGTYPYYCMVHPWMNGIVLVKAKTSSTLDKKIDDAKKIADAKKALEAKKIADKKISDAKKAAEVKQKIIGHLKKIPYCNIVEGCR